MPIIAYLGFTVKEYENDSMEHLCALTIYCPKDINAQMTIHSHYLRRIKETGEMIAVYRLICPECGKTIAVLPDFLLPYKQYSANEIEAVMIDAESMSVYDIETKASVRTVQRYA